MTTASDSGTTMWLARHAAKTSFDDIPKEVIEHAKEEILDLVGRTMCGNKTFPGKTIVDYVREMKSAPEASVMGAGFKTTAAYAAFANASLAHCLELEDIGENATFDATGILCSVLAIGEKVGASGKKVLESYIAGHEIQGRVCRASVPSTSKRVSQFKHGFLGCATGAAKVLGMDAEGIAMSISLAASQASGLFPSSATMAHYLDFRTAARSGVEAATLVQKGIRARTDILEAEHCYLEELVGPGDYDLNQMTREWGKDWAASNVLIKRYSCCFLAHRPLDTIITMMKENNITNDDIESAELEIGLYGLMLLRIDEPTNEYEMHFSYKHVLAAAMLTGRAWVDSFTEDKVTDPRYVAARKKIKVTPRPDWPKGRLGTKGIIHLKLKDGRPFTRETSETVIQSTRDELIAVYKDFARQCMSPKKVEQSVDLILNLEKVKNIAELMEIARA